MALVILLQHTHPQVPWFDSPQEWREANGYLTSTLHITLPLGLGTLLHNIMEHQAHHLDMSVSLYQLPHAQKALTNEAGHLLVHERFTWRYLADLLRCCKLYDYRKHCRLDFDGKMTCETTMLQVERL